MLKIAITKGRIEKQFTELMKESGFEIESIQNKNRKLCIETKDNFKIIFAKANDVITFIEHGIVDIGIIGKDTLYENDFEDYYEILDLNIGKCYFALCSNKEYKEKEFSKRKKIATKYPKVARAFFEEKKEDVEIIKLEGSVELGPLVGLTDAIIDLVETGTTLKENNLEVIERVKEISTRLIVNKVSLKFKSQEIYFFVDQLEKRIKEEKEC